MKTLTKHFLVVVMSFAGNFANAAEIETTPSEKEWNAIHKQMDATFGENFIKLIEVQTGWPSSYNVATSELKRTFKIDPRVLNYHLIVFESVEQEYGRKFTGCVLIIQTDEANEIRSKIENMPKRTIPIVCKAPCIGSIFIDDSFLIWISLDMLELDQKARKLISAIDEMCKKNDLDSSKRNK